MYDKKKMREHGLSMLLTQVASEDMKIPYHQVQKSLLLEYLNDTCGS
jgi:hypothetical protein